MASLRMGSQQLFMLLLTIPGGQALQDNPWSSWRPGGWTRPAPSPSCPLPGGAEAWHCPASRPCSGRRLSGWMPLGQGTLSPSVGSEVPDLPLQEQLHWHEGKSRGRKEPALRSLALTFLRPPELGEYHSHLLPRRVEGELSQRQKAGEQDRDRLAGMVLLLSPLTLWPSC